MIDCSRMLKNENRSIQVSHMANLYTLPRVFEVAMNGAMNMPYNRVQFSVCYRTLQKKLGDWVAGIGSEFHIAGLEVAEWHDQHWRECSGWHLCCSFLVCITGLGLSHRHDGSLDHRWIRWWEISPILDAQTRLQMSQVKPRSGDSWRPVLRWTRLSWSDCIRRRSKTDTCSLNRLRQDDLSDVMCSSSLDCMSQTLMFVFSISLYLFSWPPRERVPCSSSE